MNNCAEYTLQELKTSENNECICKFYSEYQENSKIDEVKCLTSDDCINNVYSIIEKSVECDKITDNKKCPDEYPIFSKGKCYKENDCPSGTNYLPFERQYKCNNKWYYDSENSFIICLDKNINCPNVYNYVVFM